MRSPLTALLIGLVAVGCLGHAPSAAGKANQTPGSATSAKPTPEHLPVATLETSKGTIRFELYTDKAPITAKNFIDLAKRKFFDGLVFHRVVDGFVIQTGDPTGTGEGGSDKTIPLEIGPGLSHYAAGIVGMARDDNPDSASSQFYITQAATTRLDGRYAVFGRVVEGLDVVMKIKVGDTMTKVTVSP